MYLFVCDHSTVCVLIVLKYMCVHAIAHVIRSHLGLCVCVCACVCVCKVIVIIRKTFLIALGCKCLL